MKSKEEFRQYCKKEWDKIEKSLFKKKDLYKALVHLENFLNTKKRNTRILSYIPIKYEIDLRKVLHTKDYFLHYLPKIEKKSMQFYYLDQAQKNKAKENSSSQQINLELPLKQEDCVILPCLGIHPLGYRLGRGSGYYDRWKEKMKDCQKIALLPEKLSLLGFPYERHDIAIDIVITEKGHREL